MKEEDPRRGLTRQANPQISIEASRATTRAALEERLGDLEGSELIEELRMMGDVVFKSVQEAAAVPNLDPVQEAALNGLVEALDKKANRLEALRLHSR